jgi:hypothetical protein
MITLTMDQAVALTLDAPTQIWDTGTVLQWPNDFTFSAPAGNITLKGSTRPGNNNIHRWYTLLGHADGATYSNPPKPVPPDIVYLNTGSPTIPVRDVWYDNMVFRGPATDGTFDVGASTMTELSPILHLTITNSDFYDSDKTMMLDSLQVKLNTLEPLIQVLLEKVRFFNCIQRMPRVGPNVRLIALDCEWNIHQTLGQYGVGIYGGDATILRGKFNGPPGAEAIRVQEGGTLTERFNNFGGTAGIQYL